MNEQMSKRANEQEEWEKYEVAVTMEGNYRVVDGKLVMKLTTGYLPLDRADSFQREQDAWEHLDNAWKVLIELDRMKQLTDNGVKLKLELDLLGISWGWEGRRDIKIRRETKEVELNPKTFLP